MTETLPVSEGRIPFGGAETWYRIVGEDERPSAVPLLLLHGGPGGTHDYMEPMAELARGGRRVVFYDQLGCGNSPHPSDPDKWTVQLFVDEVAAVREALGLERIHLLGQSWGGMLAFEYMLTRPEGIASLIICDSLSSVPLWIAEADRLRTLLPEGVQETLLAHERAGTTASDEYKAACDVYSDEHVCRVRPYPDYVARSFDQLPNEVYLTMWGPSEFFCTGSLREWDVTTRLGEINVPTLIVSGRYDESTPLVSRTINQGIEGSEWEMLENSSHVPHVEEPERFLEVVGGWLERQEQEGQRADADAGG
jgi:proline-specific peptidase